MPPTFIIDCPFCKAKVAAEAAGRAERTGVDHEAGEPFGERLHIGKCPSCHALLAGTTQQITFERFDGPDDEWSDVTRVYPNPPKVFSSYRIPKVVTQSLMEADRAMQANANIAACVMLGRALEGLCHDMLLPKKADGSAPEKKHLMLGKGIKDLRDKGIIDNRLYEWSQQLQGFRNLAAHATDVTISREEAADLQTFVQAIVEYVYDLTERYDEFKARAAKKGQSKGKPKDEAKDLF